MAATERNLWVSGHTRSPVRPLSLRSRRPRRLSRPEIRSLLRSCFPPRPSVPSHAIERDATLDRGVGTSPSWMVCGRQYTRDFTSNRQAVFQPADIAAVRHPAQPGASVDALRSGCCQRQELRLDGVMTGAVVIENSPYSLCLGLRLCSNRAEGDQLADAGGTLGGLLELCRQGAVPQRAAQAFGETGAAGSNTVDGAEWPGCPVFVPRAALWTALSLCSGRKSGAVVDFGLVADRNGPTKFPSPRASRWVVDCFGSADT